MKIALYEDHHGLPFWGGKEQPKELFDPEIHAARTLTLNKSESQRASENWIWPILMGIHAIKIPILAHVSAFCSCLGGGKWHFSKRIWVQFTNLPEVCIDGVPLIFENGSVKVQQLWGGDNRTYSPNDFLPENERATEKTEIFWQTFFEKELRAKKKSVLENARAAQRNAEELEKLFSVVN